MSKYLTEWTMTANTHVQESYTANIHGYTIAIVWKQSDIELYQWAGCYKRMDGETRRYTTMKEAQDDCTKELIADGYEFVSNERAEKLRLLL